VSPIKRLKLTLIPGDGWVTNEKQYIEPRSGDTQEILAAQWLLVASMQLSPRFPVRG